MNAKLFASHVENENLVKRVQKLADDKNVVVCHNTTSFSNFDGQHRYLILSDNHNMTIRSKSLIDYWETRYSKNYMPSIRGERGCLYAMIAKLETL